MASNDPRPVLYLDTETTGLRRPYLDGGRRIWEIGGKLVEPDGATHPLHMFIRIADLGLTDMLPAFVVGQMAKGTMPAGTWYEHLPETVQKGLEIGGFHERHPERGGDTSGAPVMTEQDAADMLMDGPWLRGTPRVVGAVPNFDDLGLFDLLYRTGQIKPDDELWNYHLVCAENYAAGALGLDVSDDWDSEELSKAVGVDPSAFARHCAVDDALWAEAMYEAARRLRRGEAVVC